MMISGLNAVNMQGINFGKKDKGAKMSDKDLAKLPSDQRRKIRAQQNGKK